MATSTPTAQPQSDVVIVGAPRQTLHDVFHLFLRAPWSVAIGGIAVVWLAINAVFGGIYWVIGGVSGAREHSLWDTFIFSVQTMGTIGYGSMYPTSVAANVCMTAESVIGLVVTAVATGLVFAKFSRTTTRVVFGHQAVIGPMDGVPTLMMRIGNERGNAILEATARLVMIRTDHLKEGGVFYRMIDLKLARERSPAMQRSWTVQHPITPDSPLWGATPESLKKDEIEFVINLVGTDDTSLQAVHARARYTDDQVLWGAKHADVLTEGPDGILTMDVRKFHLTVPTVPIEGFPYPRPAPAVVRK
jgi:inward rectifier potassium channel